VRLDHNDVVIQGGLTLQILTNNKFMAQAHKVVVSDGSIGRMSVTHFIYPTLDLELRPLKKFLNEEEPLIDFNDNKSMLAPNDVDLLNPAVLPSNHWYDGVKWIEFHQN
jgi:isopenicillin N synthase-like dioxygenase